MPPPPPPSTTTSSDAVSTGACFASWRRAARFLVRFWFFFAPGTRPARRSGSGSFARSHARLLACVRRRRARLTASGADPSSSRSRSALATGSSRDTVRRDSRQEVRAAAARFTGAQRTCAALLIGLAANAKSVAAQTRRRLVFSSIFLVKTRQWLYLQVSWSRSDGTSAVNQFTADKY